MKLSKPEREQLRMMFGGRCAYCGCELPKKGWHADHVEPVVRCYQYGEMVTSTIGDVSYQRYESFGNGKKKVKKLDNPSGERKDNLWPSCCPCNINKSSQTIESWRKFLMEGPESLAAYNGRFNHMLRFGVVIVNPEPLRFWFEKYAELSR
jgi:hypothetical protein